MAREAGGLTWRASVVRTAATFGVAAALLFLDGHLGPVSFTLRRAAALMVLAIIAASTWTRRGAAIAAVDLACRSGDPSPSRPATRVTSTPRNLVWRIAGPATVIAALMIVARAPSVPVVLVGFLVALAAIDSMAGPRSRVGGPAAGLVPLCLTYVGLRFMVDLVPQAGAVGEAVAWCGSHYIGYARGVDVRLSHTALGAPALGLAVLYLLYGLRRVGGSWRAFAAIVVPLAWFALLPAVTAKAADGPIAVFSRGAFHGLFWLGAAGFTGAFARARPGAATPDNPGVQQPVAVARHVIVVGLVSALAGVCLVGTAYVVPATARSIRVYNGGGLDWGRPAFGRFGTFSGGMFGLWPVYSRAEGYDFDVIDRAGNSGASALASSEAGPDSAAPAGRWAPSRVDPASPKRAGSPSAAARSTSAEPPRRGQVDLLDISRQDLRVAERVDSVRVSRDAAGAASVGFQRSAAGSATPAPAGEKGSARASPSRVASPTTADASAKTGAPPNEAAAKREEESRRLGGNPRFVETIEAADLDKIQILVLINSPKIWDQRDRRTIYDFVARGGNLLVLGDHTDVFGLMRGFNTLLGPLGIKFRFDSAYKARETWRGCQVAAPDLVAWGWDDENPGVAVGASLELSGNARPLLVGRYALSDAGVRENVMGSFLGNYHYDTGERLGDVVLVATTTYGRGRIVVWGDTSAFQGGLSSNYRTVVGPMLTWLSRPVAWTERPAVRMVAAMGLLAVVLWCWVVAATPKQLASISVSLLLGMLVPWVLSRPNLNVRPLVDRDAFLIDRSHMEATGHYAARVNSIGPLYTNLLRSGFRVLDMDDWDAAAIRRARGIGFVAPQKSFTHKEVEALLRAEENGAVVILATGQPDSEASGPLLEAHGLALVPRPMGTVTSAEPTASRREREQQPRFLDAWPIVADGEGDPAGLPGVEIIYRQGDDVVALFRRVGKGGLLLIADTRFFSDMNVEDMSGYWLGNLALIHDLFKKYLGADPDAVKPLFRSPEKPQ